MPVKLVRPGSKGALLRNRIFKLIDRGLEKKLTWISGPAGSGKTTLVSSYIESRGLPCIWYQLDAGDSDLATFFYYLGIAAKNADPRNRRPLPVLTSEYLQGIPAFTRRFFEQLGNRLMNKAGYCTAENRENPVIVFDNYQEIPEDSLFHEIIRTGISSLHESLNIVFVSRGAPPPAYAGMHSNNDMELLGWEDIQLTSGESDSIAMLRAGRELDRDTLARIYQISGGWVAALVLLLESIETGDGPEFPDVPVREEIFMYFAAELFDRMSEDIRLFLLETSFLPRMNSQMARALTENQKAQRIFSDLSRNNYFTSRHTSSSETVFQYHPLFRDFLKTRARETMAAGALANLRCRAAKVLEENGYSEDAVNLYCEAEEWQSAVQIILDQASELIAQGRRQPLLDWIELLPRALRDSHPWLLYWTGMCLLSADGSTDYFEEAFRKFDHNDDAEGSFLALSGMLDSVTFRVDTFQNLDSMITAMDALLEKHSRFPSFEIECRVTSAMLYALMMRQPESPSWEYWEARGLALAEKIPDAGMAIHILGAVAYYRLFSGDLEKALLILDSIKSRGKAGMGTPMTELALKNLEAMYFWLSAEFEKCRQTVEDGITLSDSTGIHYIDFGLLGHGTAGALSTGDIAGADRYLRMMFSVMHQAGGKNSLNMYHYLQAWKHLIDGNLTRASMHADQAIASGKAMGSTFQEPYQHMAKALVMHELKNDEEAFLHLSRFREICNRVPIYQAEFMYFIAMTYIEFDLGDEVSGKKHLREAMKLGKAYGYANGFCWSNYMAAKLCVKALEEEIERDYVQELITRRGLVPDETAYSTTGWPWPLKISTLGQFEIIRNGEVFRLHGKGQQKPVLILKALIAFGGRQVYEQKICDALWPDTEGDLAHRSFETALYRLRRMLGSDGILLFQEGKLSLNTQVCRVDILALEGILQEARILWSSVRNSQSGVQTGESRDRAAKLTRMAISIYKEDFLIAEKGHPWLLSCRERLRARYLRGMENLFSYWEATGRPEMAIECCEKALEVDNLIEIFYGRLIDCYNRMDRRAEALAVYDRCRFALKNGLGIEPSEQTRSLIGTRRLR